MRYPRIAALGLLLLASAFAAAPLGAAPSLGRLSGVVVDATGVPQMGASISILSEDVRGSAPMELLTNDRGVFTTERLLPGLYSVRVTLAGFLPAVERHIKVQASLTTLLKIELDSLLLSFDRLRRRPNDAVEADEWMWVLRTSAATRPVLRWADGEVVLDGETTGAEAAKKNRPHGRLELTAGARRPGSVANLPDAPSSAFAYQQRIGRRGQLLLAGQMSYERSATAGFATTWLPAGEDGPRTTLMLRQSNLAPGGPNFRGLRMQHENQWRVADRITLRYGAEYIRAGLGHSASSLVPQAEMVIQVARRWRASLTVASRPWSSAGQTAGALESALMQLDAFPAVLLRDGRPLLAGGWHEEFAVEHQLGPNSSIVAAAFRDRSRNTAVFGRGSVASPDFFQDYYSGGFAYDGGHLNHWGTRLAFRQKFADGTEAAVVYALAGALVPQESASELHLRDLFEARNCHSVAARISTRLPMTSTRLAASYKWVGGEVVSRQDPFGEITYQVDPQLNLTVRQPLPTFLFPGKLEALADFRNLLAQGYVPMSTTDGQVVLMPAFRSFRGGFSFQF